MSNSTEYFSASKNLTLDEAILVYGNTPLGVLGFVLHLLIVWIFSADEFKEKPIVYLKIGCFLSAIDLFIITFRSLSTSYICIAPDCAPLDVKTAIFKTLIFVYLPSPIEASILVAEIFTVFSRLAQLKLKNRSGFHLYVLKSNPYRAILIAFAFFSILFSYQIFSQPHLFYINFFAKHRRSFSILMFAIRDGFLLVVLVILNIKIGIRVNNSMKRKMSISIGTSVVRRATKARSRINVIILAFCTTTIIGRIPILFLVLATNFYKSFPPGLLAFCLLSLSLSYTLKFFLFWFINKRFKNLLFEKLGFKKITHV